MEPTYPTYEELVEEIRKETTGNDVACLLTSIYGEDKGIALWRVWMSGNENRFAELVNRERDKQLDW